MTNVSPQILAQQLAYAARPFAVRWVDSHVSLTNRFHTLDDALDYVQDQWAKVQKRVSENRYMASMLGHCYLETPKSRVQLTYVLLCHDVSSY